MTAATAAPSWKLFEHGLLVFERALTPTGPYRLLVSRTEVCSERGCDCRDVGLSAVGLELGSDLGAAQLDYDGLRKLLDAGRPMSANVGIDSGLVDPDDYEGRVPLSDDWANYLESEIDGELLDLFQSRWLAAKKYRPRSWQDVEWPAGGLSQLIPWRALHPDDRRDLYLFDDQWFVATELYCPNPTCTCTEARIEFIELLEKDSRLVGHVRLRLPSVDVIESKANSNDPTLLDGLWNDFCARHRRLGERLTKRRLRMTEIGKARAASAPTTPAVKPSTRVGRNDPCPCGSGKKHKQCCLGSPTPGQPS